SCTGTGGVAWRRRTRMPDELEVSGTGRLDDALLRAFLVERFEDMLALEQGAAANTIAAYGRDVRRLVEFAGSRGARLPLDVTARMLRDFVYHLKDLGLAPTSIRRVISAVRSYFGFLVAEGAVVSDPSDRLDAPARWRTLPEVLTVAEVEALLTAPG